MKAYTYNDRLVGVGNDQILGTDQGGGTTYTAGAGIDITNDVISVDDTVALVSALPTTELGKFTIQSNVSGGPIEVICPTDQAPDSVFYQINSVSGYAYASSYSNAVINYYYGETPADFNGSDDAVSITINDNISNIGSIQFFYTTSETGVGGPSLSTTDISGGSTGVVQSGTYKVKAQYNQAGTSSSYGKYLEVMFYWRSYATDAAQSLQWAQEALSKITFFGIVRPDPTLGTIVNLDRYSLGNTSTITNTSGYTQATIYTDPTSKKQSVYLPSSMPSNWNGDIAQAFQYGSNYNSPSSWKYDYKLYKAYKYTSSPTRYQFAYLTDWDSANKLMTFVAYDNSGNAIEKWTLDYTTYSSNVWTTTPISSDTSDYIPYSASGVYLPNSKFEIDTEGQAYKVIVASSDVQHTLTNSWGAVTMGGEFPAGTYEFRTTDSSVAKILKVEGVEWHGIPASGLNFVNGVATWINTETFSTGNTSFYLKDSSNNNVTFNADTTKLYQIVNPVTEEYLTDGDLELNGDSEVTAIDGHAIAGGDTQVQSDWTEDNTSDPSYIQNKPTEIQLIAGANVQVEVTGASAIISAQGGGGATYSAGQYVSIDSNDVISVTGVQPAGSYATETYVQNYSVPVKVVASAAAATGTNILYVVTG